MNKIYKIIEKQKLPNCRCEITAEISKESLDNYKEKALKKIRENAEISGFRKGKAPEKMLKERIGEIGLLEDAGEMAINDCLAEIIAESKISFIGHPSVTISKIAIGSPIEFKIIIIEMPKVKLTNYKKIAAKENLKEEKKEEISDKQVDETIEEIRKMYAKQNSKDKDGKIPDLPEINDDFVKKLGEFKDVSDFKIKLKENIAREKELKAKDKKMISIIEKIIEESEIEMPKLLSENELEKMKAQFIDDITQMGLKPEDYLKHIKKTWVDLEKEWLPDAEKRAKVQLTLHQIAIEEKIESDKKVADEETKKLLNLYKEADPERTRAYVETQLISQKVFKFLEEQK